MSSKTSADARNSGCNRSLRRLVHACLVGLGVLCNTAAVAGPMDADQDPPPPNVAPLLAARSGVTAVAGRVLSAEGLPLRSVVIADGAARTLTDQDGRYLLENVIAGKSVLIIDGQHARASASGLGTDYGYYEVAVSAQAGRTTALDYTNWLTRIDHAHDVALDLPLKHQVTITTPSVPGLELRLPAGTVLTGPDHRPVTHVGLTQIPVRRPPFPLPRNVHVPIYFTAQPGGTVLSSTDGSWLGAQIVYPNYNKALPKARATLWRYQPDDWGWEPYGTAKVSDNGTQVLPDKSARIYQLTGAMVCSEDSSCAPPELAPAFCPDPPFPPPICPKAGDPVDIGSGLFINTVTDLRVNDVMPLSVTRTYNSNDRNVHSFGVGMTLSYDMWLYEEQPNFAEVDLVLPDGTRIPFVWQVGGGPYQNFASFSTTPGTFYGAQLTWNNSGGPGSWRLRMHDGTTLLFGTIAPLQAIQDRFGNITNITRTSNTTVVTSPNGRTLTFQYSAGNGSGSYVTQVIDNVGRTIKYNYDSANRLHTVVDADNGTTTYNWDTTNNRIQSIVDQLGNQILSNQYCNAPAAGTCWTSDQVQQQTLADGATYGFQYTTNSGSTAGLAGQPEVVITNPRQYVRQVTLSSQGFVLLDQQAYGTPIEQDTSFTYTTAANAPEPLGYPNSMTDALSRTTNWTYDAGGDLLTETKLANTSQAVTASYTYSAFGNVTQVTDPLSHVTTICRDAATDEALTVTDANGFVTLLGYNDEGQLSSITDPLANVTTLGYAIFPRWACRFTYLCVK